ncbi:MAG TPA: hypothetical protein VLJ61_03495 [Pyrinomonadaceae bacterium]|nr:hypothetical protein [Pyrinomonadaceae bacterium]
MPEESFNALLSALQHLPLKIHQHRVFDDSVLEPQGISSEDIKVIRDALFPLYRGRGSGTVPVTKFVGNVAESLTDAEGGGPDWIQNEELLGNFKERLIHLLSLSSPLLIAKAHDILLEHAQTFSSVRIVSDIRPVFGESVEGNPVAAVLVHMLNLVYYESGERREFVVAMDTKDIQVLLEACERAAKKTKSLESVIASTNMTYIEVV